MTFNTHQSCHVRHTAGQARQWHLGSGRKFRKRALALSLDHRLDPDRHVRGNATFGDWPVAIETDLFADGDRALAELGAVNANRSQRVVHGPLHLRGCLGHIFFDAIQERGEIEVVSPFIDVAGGEIPAGASGPAIFRLHPFFT